MHGRPGEIRRQPSTDEKKTKRQMQRSAELEEPVMGQSHTAAIADLLGRAQTASTLGEQQSLMLEVETLRTTASTEAAAGTDFDFRQARITDRLVPEAVYERDTVATDWLLDLSTTADLHQAGQEMVVAATLWFNGRPDEVKAYGGEFAEQARNQARHLAGQYGDQADAAERVFLDEAARLRSIAVRAGIVVEAIDQLVEDTVGRMKDGADVEGLDQMSDAVTQQYTAGLDDNTAITEDITKHAASQVGQVGETGIPTDTFSTLTGETALPPGATDSNRAPQLQEMQGYTGWDGSSVVSPDDGHAEADNQSGVTQDHARPQTGFPIGASRTAALKPGDCINCGTNNWATREAAHSTPEQIALTGQCSNCGGTRSYQQPNTKESHMTQAQAHAQCPTCGGQGKVAVRVLTPKEAYSGLPQIDEIMNNSDTAPEQTPYPAEVAFPVTWDAGTVPTAINQTEQQIAERNQRSPLATGAARAQDGGQAVAAYRRSIERQAMDGMSPGGVNSGRDNSGWMGDMGARGTDYPGYSSPNYGGPSNLGQPDPVYGEGGDNGNQPMLPYGHAEADDLTNNPQQWAYGQPAQADVGASTVSQTMNVQGGLSQAQKIAAVQQRIAEDQRLLAAVYEGRA